MYSRLLRLIEPSFISSAACDVFEETLLKAAGIETQPTQCQFKEGSAPSTHDLRIN